MALQLSQESQPRPKRIPPLRLADSRGTFCTFPLLPRKGIGVGGMGVEGPSSGQKLRRAAPGHARWSSPLLDTACSAQVGTPGQAGNTSHGSPLTAWNSGCQAGTPHCQGQLGSQPDQGEQRGSTKPPDPRRGRQRPLAPPYSTASVHKLEAVSQLPPPTLAHSLAQSLDLWTKGSPKAGLPGPRTCPQECCKISVSNPG